ncbi:unnamed protein product [Arctogadus glacialis]
MGLPRSVRRVKLAVADIPLDVHLLFLLGPWGPGLTGSYMDQPTSSCWPETVVDHKNSCWPEPSVDHLNRCCPERSLDHPKASSCPETSVDHTKGSCCPETIVVHPKGCCPETSVDPKAAPLRLVWTTQKAAAPLSPLWSSPAVYLLATHLLCQRKASVDTTESGKGTASMPTASYGVATETVEVNPAVADPLDVTQKNKNTQGRVKRFFKRVLKGFCRCCCFAHEDLD